MKRSPELEPLSHDHFEGLVLASRMAKGIENLAPPALVAAYVSHSWQTHLSDHFLAEEDLLVPLADSDETRALTSRMLTEHATITALIGSIRDNPASSSDLILELSRELVSHIRFEERSLFPALENEVPAERLREVGRQLERADRTPGPDWTIAFWDANSFPHDTAATDPLPRHRSVAVATRDACLAAALSAYEDASIAGLCREGAWENAVGAIKSVDLEAILQAGRNA